MLKVVLLLNFKQKFKGGGKMEGEREIELDVELLWEFSHLKFLSYFGILSPPAVASESRGPCVGVFDLDK